MGHWYDMKTAKRHKDLHWPAAKKQGLAPGLTTVLQSMAAPGLELWKRETLAGLIQSGWALAEAKRQMAKDLEAKAEMGSAVHHGIEHLVHLENGHCDEAEAERALRWSDRLGMGELPRKMLDAAKDASRMLQSVGEDAPVRCTAEVPVTHPICAVGTTVDLAVTVDEGVSWVWDFKTRNDLDDPSVYTKEWMQVAAGAEFLECRPAGLVLGCRKTGNVHVAVINQSRVPIYIGMVYACATLWYGERGMKPHEYAAQVLGEKHWSEAMGGTA